MSARSMLANTTVAALETLVTDTMRDRHIPGLAIGIVKDGQRAYARGFGVARITGQQPVTPDTTFSLASLAKAVTATALLQLVEAGMVRLDAPVTDYLPSFRLADPRFTDIRIRHLLTHTSGLGFWPPLPEEDLPGYWRTVTPELDAGAAERYLRTLHDCPLQFGPGSGYAYSDAGYNVVGNVIAKVSGQLSEDYVQEHIFTPLGMQHSTFLLRAVDPHRLAWPHHLDAGGTPMEALVFPYTRPQAPSAHLFSTVGDMTRWALANLNRGVLEGARILDSSSYALAWGAHVAPEWIDPAGPATRSYGFGWFIEPMDEHMVVRHGGAELGYGSHIVLAPDDGLGVVIMGNRFDTFSEPFYPRELGTAVLQLLL